MKHLLLIPLLVLFSCDEAFSPSAPGEPKMVLYSILTTESDTQYVRVYSTYVPPGNDPLKNPEDRPVTDATVTMSDRTTIVTFRNVSVPRSDKSRYASDISAYTAYPFRAKNNTTYTLTATSPTLGSATSTATVPGRGEISIPYFYYLDNPWRYSGLSPTASLKLSPLATAFMVKLFIEYEARGDDLRQHIMRWEVPAKLDVVSCPHEIYRFNYPKLKRRSTPSVSRIDQRDAFGFTHFAYRRSMEMISERNLNVKYRRVVYYLIQFDETWYRYYGVANAVSDKFTVWLDEPDFTNIQSGVGVFASLTVDSIDFGLPEIMPLPRSGVLTPCR